MANQVTIASVMLHGNGQARLIRCAGAVHFFSKMADETFLSHIGSLDSLDSIIYVHNHMPITGKVFHNLFLIISYREYS